MAHFRRPAAIAIATLAFGSLSTPVHASDAGLEPIRDGDFAMDFDPGEPICIAFPRGRLAAGCDAALALALVASTEKNTTESTVPVIVAFVPSTPTPWGLAISRSAPSGEPGEGEVDRLEHELAGTLGSEGPYGTKKVEKGTVHTTPYIRLEWEMGPQREGASGRRVVAYALYGGSADYMVVAVGDPSQSTRIDSALSRSLDTLKLSPPTTQRSTTSSPATLLTSVIVSAGLLILIAWHVRSLATRTEKRRR